MRGSPACALHPLSSPPAPNSSQGRPRQWPNTPALLCLSANSSACLCRHAATDTRTSLRPQTATSSSQHRPLLTHASCSCPQHALVLPQALQTATSSCPATTPIAPVCTQRLLARSSVPSLLPSSLWPHPCYLERTPAQAQKFQSVATSLLASVPFSRSSQQLPVAAPV